MIGCGVGMTLLTVVSTFWLWRGTLYDKRWLLWIFVIGIVPAIVANETGWVAAEVGRQPWIVHAPFKVDQAGERVVDAQGQFAYEEGLGLRTTDGVSKAVKAEQVLTSIIMFGAIYFLLGILWLFLLNRKIQAGPTYKLASESEGLGEAVAGEHTLTGDK
jgi:cytochrome d ubiquinol oxidase subunit I